MKKLIEFFARQGLFAELVTFLVLGVGLYSLLTIRREAFPNIQYDIITITTVFPGAAPSEVEKLITSALEQELKEVEGIKKMFSTSIEGLSSIAIQLDPDQTTQEEAKVDVQDVIDRVNDLPEEAEDPVVMALESSIFPVVEVAIHGAKDSFTLKETARYLEEELETVKGVSRVDLKGEREYEIRVEVPAQKLKAYQVTLMEVVKALKEQNISIPGGTYTSLNNKLEKDVIVRTEGEFIDVEDVKKTVVRSNDIGRAITLGDIATISLSLKKQQISHRVNGAETIRLVVMKKEKADAISLINGIKEKLKSGLIEEKVKGIKFEFVNDFSIFIKRRLGVLSGNLTVGLILVVLILSLFLPFRISLVVGIGIPFSFLGTMIFFQQNGISLNLITMMGLIIVVGMLVDDAIVVTESSIREMEDGKSPLDAAINATQKVWLAIFASVMTTVLAFFPMLIMTGIFGKFVSYIPIGVICALLISLIECYFVLPYHLSKWVNVEKLRRPKKGFKKYFNNGFDRLTNGYGRIIGKVVDYKWITILLFFMIIGLSFLNVAKNMKFVLFPPDGIDQFIVKAKAPNGSTLQQTQELLQPLEKFVSDLPKKELVNYVTTIGEYRESEDQPGERGTHLAQIMVFLTPETDRNRNALEIIESMRSTFKKTNDLDVTFEKINGGPPVGKPISIGIRGDNYKEIMPLVEKVIADLKNIKGTKDISHNFSEGKEQIVVRVNPEKAQSVGLSAQAVGMTVMSAFEGIIATTIRNLDDEIDVRVSLPEEEKRARKGIGDFNVLNSTGQLVSLRSISKFSPEKGIEAYYHVDNKRQVTISGDVDTELVSALEANEKIRAKQKEYLAQHPTLNFNFGGEDEDTQEGLASLGRAFILALILIYFLLILTFQSFKWPFIIILVIPIGIASVTWALFVHGEPLSFMGMLGVVALAGVVVNNAIVFIDYILAEHKEGMNPRESIIQAGKLRLRPIVLTTATTVFGILPTAYGLGGLDEFVVPIALSLGWGILIGAILTSLFLPAFVAVMLRTK